MSRLKIILLCVVAVAVLVMAGLASGAIPLLRADKYGHPPCGQLPTKAAVVDAIAHHADLMSRFQGVGSGVKVGVGSPCEGQPDRALVSISYSSDNEEKGVNAILVKDGFGVPAQPFKG